MTTRRQEPWRAVLAESIEDPGQTNATRETVETEPDRDVEDVSGYINFGTMQKVVPNPGGLDKLIDVDYQGQEYEVEQAPLVLGDDGDDSPEYEQAKPRPDNDKLERGDISDPVQVKPPVTDNPAGELAAAGHGFLIDDKKSRPWKTAPRTNCAHCGGEMPPPSVGDPKYRCEFDPNAGPGELALIGSDQPKDERDHMWDALSRGKGCRHQAGCRCFRRGCQCSGCILRDLVLNEHERNVGGPKKYCSKDCGKWADSARSAWKRAVVSAKKRGDEPPQPPEDKGLKFRPVRRLRSGIEGNGHRYVTAVGLPWTAPRA